MNPIPNQRPPLHLSGLAGRIQEARAPFLCAEALIAFVVSPLAGKARHHRPAPYGKIETIPACPKCQGDGCGVCRGTGLTEADFDFDGLARGRVLF